MDELLHTTYCDDVIIYPYPDINPGLANRS